MQPPTDAAWIRTRRLTTGWFMFAADLPYWIDRMGRPLARGRPILFGVAKVQVGDLATERFHQDSRPGRAGIRGSPTD